MGYLSIVQICQILIGLFLGICMFQSGTDKILDWKGNYQWLQDHFSKTFLTERRNRETDKDFKFFANKIRKKMEKLEIFTERPLLFVLSLTLSVRTLSPGPGRVPEMAYPERSKTA